MSRTVALIGLGHMGGPMVANLVKSGGAAGMSTEYETILVERTGRTALLTLNRPEARTR
ncbi:NAD(P)-binding domain-containing protein [Streptomyces sp. NBC_01239]|uniref:NAD(P)-binding domain-containing protein n=1 Tax=Streptomyces sp. NBC_01239 TaxID=2903792 RepID=UPI00224F811B|nr:NAD(P)-binding domain-containing protein [Streptomyces sp. NBC_01239]MCX4817505.1 NAD(P)-binding domain-containing protein [Streptomyces sp. NBC_01239]